MSDSHFPPEATLFDVEKIKSLLELMKDNDVNEIELRHQQSRLRLRRGGLTTSVVAAAPATVYAPPAAGAPAVVDKPAAVPDDSLTVASPFVGTFYTASAPDVPPFVAVGAKVQANTTICIIEAMKVMNEIPAGVVGTVVEVLVENGQPVEWGKPLFRVKP
ncbi:MAG: acetyl-CoA carboxylase biotin carboxyl carrier protein [Planctomycetia bacterium]